MEIVRVDHTLINCFFDSGEWSHIFTVALMSVCYEYDRVNKCKCINKCVNITGTTRNHKYKSLLNMKRLCSSDMYIYKPHIECIFKIFVILILSRSICNFGLVYIYMNTRGGPAGWGSGKFHISWDFQECFNNLTHWLCCVWMKTHPASTQCLTQIWL